MRILARSGEANALNVLFHKNVQTVHRKH